MSIVGILVGVPPFTAFSRLAVPVGAGVAALVGVGVGVVIIATTARGGVTVLPVVTAVMPVMTVMAVMAVAGFVADESLRADLARYGPAVAALLIGAFVVITAARAPFPAPSARRATPARCGTPGGSSWSTGASAPPGAWPCSRWVDERAS